MLKCLCRKARRLFEPDALSRSTIALATTSLRSRLFRRHRKKITPRSSARAAWMVPVI